MLTYLRENPDVRYVIVYARSRAFRNYIDAAITKRLLDKLNVKLVSAREDFGDGVYADMMEAVTDIFNDVQNKLSGEDIRIKLQHKAINGGTTGKAPIGYLNVRVEHEGRLINTVQIDPKRAPLVRRAFELYATGDYGVAPAPEATLMADLGLSARATGKAPRTPGHLQVAAPYVARPLLPRLHRLQGRGLRRAARTDYRSSALRPRERSDGSSEQERSARPGSRSMSQGHPVPRPLRTPRTHFTSDLHRGEEPIGARYGYFLCRGRQDGVCDLPYLPANSVEQAIADHYVTLKLPTTFVTDVRRLLEEALAGEQHSVAELHAALSRKLKELEAKEDKLLDLLADDALPKTKVKTKLRKIQVERNAAQASLANTGAELAIGAEVLLDALDLMSDPETSYADGSDAIRRNINETFYQRFYLDEQGVQASELIRHSRISVQRSR